MDWARQTVQASWAFLDKVQPSMQGYAVLDRGVGQKSPSAAFLMPEQKW